MKYMSFIRLLFLAFCCSITVLTSCSPDGSETLNEAETNQIEDILLESIKKNKIKAYADAAMQNEVPFSNLERMIQIDSTGRQDLSGFAVITEEEVAIKNGDFKNTSHDIAGVLLMTHLNMGGESFVLPLANVKWKSVKKVLNKDLQDKLHTTLSKFLTENDSDYVEVIRSLRRQEITKSIFNGLQDGSIAAYENENMAHVISPTELPDYDTRKEVINVPDPEFPGEFKDSLIRTSRKPDDIVDFTPHFDESGNLMAISLVYQLEAQDILVNIPWVCVSMDDVSAFIDESMVAYLRKEYGGVEEENSAGTQQEEDKAS